MVDRIRFGTIIFFTAAFVFFLILGRTKLLQDPDTFWHIVVGQQILDGSRLIFADEFTFSFYGQKWIANQWLSECMMSLTDRLAGFDGLVLVVSSLLAVLYAWIGNRLLKCGLHWLMVVFVLTLVFAASAYNLHVRPHLATIFLFAIVFALLIDFESGRKRIRQLWWLVPLFILWTNLHGGVLGGLGTLGVAIAGWTGLKWIGRESPIQSNGQCVMLWIILGVCVASTLVNPYGLAMHVAWLRILQANLPELVIEHAPLDITQPEGLMVVLLALMYLAALLTTGRNQTTLMWLMPLLWLVLALTRIRHAPLFAVAVAIVLPEVLPNSKIAVWLRLRGWMSDRSLADLDIKKRSTRYYWWPALVPVLLFVLICIDCRRQLTNQPGRVWARPNTSVWPAGLLPALNQQAPQIEGANAEKGLRVPIFNEQEFGGFLIYNSFPQYQVFIDGRCELFGEDFLRSYMRSRTDWQIIRQWEEQYGFELAISKSGSPIDDYFSQSQSWIELKKTATATLYKRMNSENDELN